MATLLAGEQYGLKSSENSRQNKSFVFVKLTDSAYKAIEEYIRNSVSYFFDYFPSYKP